VVGETFGEFGELNVIHQYFTQPNFISIFCKTLDIWIKVCTCMSRDWRCELGCEAVNLEISPSLEAKFDPLG